MAITAWSDILEPYGLRWFEDIWDPLDFDTHRAVIARYGPPVSAGEAIFSASDARNLLRYAGLRPGHDVLTFDPAHCYGIPEYVRIIQCFENAGWSLRDFQPHGGHLYSLHIAAALGLGGCECNPHNFQHFGGFADATTIVSGRAGPPDAPGIGFETRRSRSISSTHCSDADSASDFSFMAAHGNNRYGIGLGC